MESSIELEELLKSRGTYRDAIGLPPKVYSDPDFFVFEREAVFSSEWLCVGREEQVHKVGDYFSATPAGEPIIVVRNSESEIRAMSSVCPHRGMCVTADLDGIDDENMLEPTKFLSGNVRYFRCPYHWWVFNLEGQLTGAPEMKDTDCFRVEDTSLEKIALEIWNGFVFVNFDINADPLGPSLEKLEKVVKNYDLSKLKTVDPAVIPDVPFNWKIMIENFMEMYHNSRLHKGIHDWAPSAGAPGTPSSYSEFEPEDGAMFGFNPSLEMDGGFNPTYKALFPPLPNLTDEERQRVVFAFVPPTLLIGMQSDSAFWFTVNPTSPETHELSMAYLFPEEVLEIPLFDELLEAAIRGVGYFNRQDIPTNIATHLGLSSRFANRAHYSWQEAVIPQFNSWLVDRYEKQMEGK